MFSLNFPLIFSLELTQACNNHCPGCGNVFGRKQAIMGLPEWEQILRSIQPYARQIKITGGEPTLHPQFEQIVHAIDRLEVPYAIFSNARWPDPAGAIGFFSGLPNLGGLLISLHGHRPDIHERFTCIAGSFDQTCANIRRAVEAGIGVHTSTVINSYNAAYIEEIAELARNLGVTHTVFNRFIGPCDSPYQVSELQLRAAIDKIEKLIRLTHASLDGQFTVRYGNCIPQCFSDSASVGCWAAVSYCTVDPLGNLRPCNHSPTVIGNLFESSLVSLWQSPKINAWRNLTSSSCRSCNAYERCHGGCHALLEIEPSKHDPLVGAPIKSLPDKTIDLYRFGTAHLNCDIFEIDSGYVFVQGVSIFPVRAEASPLISDLYKNKTLLEFGASYGQDGLDLLGDLIVRGYVKLEI